jgi:hypothetical protein
MVARQGRPELTRRALIRKLALPVAGIVRLPVVETILMPRSCPCPDGHHVLVAYRR